MLTMLNRAISGFLYRGSVIGAWVGGIAMTAMGIVVLAGVVARKVPFFPNFPTNYEWASMLMAVVSTFGLAYCWYVGGHIRIDLIPEKLGPRVLAVLDIVGAVSGIAFLIAITWVSWSMGIERMAKGVTMHGGTPNGPPTVAFAIAMGFFALVLVRSIIGFLLKAAGRKVEHDGLY